MKSSYSFTVNREGATQGEMKITPARVVLPFYLYGALAFVASALMLFISGDIGGRHHAHPHTLAITHTAVLGWATMIILGSAHQLLPVLTGFHLASQFLALTTFFLAATGIPVLVTGFYFFDMSLLAPVGGSLVLAAGCCFLVNVILTVRRGALQIQSAFVLAAASWLVITMGAGLLLVFNFTHSILPLDSLSYLSWHAHLGIIGWFFTLVTGVGSRLIPMFLVSKYSNTRLLRWIFWLIQVILPVFTILYFILPQLVFPIVGSLLFLSILLFGYFCYRCHKERLRKKIDAPMRLSLFAAITFLLPFVVLALIASASGVRARLILVYGFVILFGWITALILGMTFKTLPFIIWNRLYNSQAGIKPVPSPADLYSHKAFRIMSFGYLAGFGLFIAGLLAPGTVLITVATAFLLLAAVLYCFNVFYLFTRKTAPR